jgi:MYXO-CTERM domain-containing protein
VLAGTSLFGETPAEGVQGKREQKMKMGVLAGAVALALSGVASAAFTGFSSVTSILGDGKVRTEVFANFDGANDTLLNVFGLAYLGGIGTNGFGAGNFYHKDFTNGLSYSTAVGSWSPTLVPAGVPATEDSWLTIGGNAGDFGNSTAFDPAWGGAGSNQPGLVAGAGWFNQNPPNNQGKNVGGLTRIGNFVTDFGKTWIIGAQSGYNTGAGTPPLFGEGTFTVGVPAPGALALLGLAGLAGRRRRA